MKFFKTRKYSVKLSILKYSFIAVVATSLIFSTFISKNIASAVGESLKVSNVTSSSVSLIALGLRDGVDYSLSVSDGRFENVPIYQDAKGVADITFSDLHVGIYSVGLSYTENGHLYTDVAQTSFQIEQNYALPSRSDLSGVVITETNMVGTSVDVSIFGLETLKSPINIIDVYLSTKDGSYANTKNIDPQKISAGSEEVTFEGLKTSVLYSAELQITLSTGEVLKKTSEFLYGNSNVVKINSISPMSGSVGDMVTISGDNFIGVSSIKFGTISTITTTNSKNEITAKVPVGATNSQIIVTTLKYGSATSADVFLVNSTGTPVDTSVPATTSSAPSSSTKTAIVWHGLVPECSRTGDKIDSVTGNYSHPCDFNVLIGLINRLISFILVDLALPLFALIIIYVAWLYLSSGGSSENITKAKKIFFNVIIGYIIALAAWLIVKTILATLGFTGDSYLS